MFTRNLCTMALTVMVAPLFATQWQTDFEAAKAQAAKEGKAMLLDFTGSDWCGCCNQLRKDVLDTPEFMEYAAGKFVCVEVDMPRKKKQPAPLAEQNKKLCKTYDVRMFPTILVLSPTGDVLGGFIGTRASLDRVRQPLDHAFSNLAKLQAARQEEGRGRTRGLKEIYSSIPVELQSAAAAYLPEIDANTPEPDMNPPAQTYERFLRDVNATGADRLTILGLIDDRLVLGIETEKPELLRLKGMTMVLAAETEEDILAAEKVMAEAVSLMGDSRRALLLQTEMVWDFSDPAALLARVKQRRAEESAGVSAQTEAESYIDKLQDQGIDLRDALAELEEQLVSAPDDQKAELLRLKGALLLHLAETDEERDAANAILQEASGIEQDFGNLWND